MKFNKRTISIAAVALLLVGGASAGVVNYFGQTSGTVTVDKQAVSFDGQTSISKSLTPPASHGQVVEVSSNADAVAEYEWTTESSDSVDENVASHGVYKVQHYQGTTTTGDTFDVRVEPYQGTLAIETDYPDFDSDRSDENVDIEFSISDAQKQAYDDINGNAPHIVYHETNGWKLDDGTGTKIEGIDGDTIEDYSFIKSASATEDDGVRVVLRGGAVEDQSFAVRFNDENPGAVEIHDEDGDESEGFNYGSLEDHKTGIYSGETGVDQVIKPGQSQNYTVSAFVNEGADFDSYQYTVEVSPLTTTS